jgi:hypothetical protein
VHWRFSCAGTLKNSREQSLDVAVSRRPCSPGCVALIGNGYDLLGLDPLYEQITLGVILLLAVGLDAWSRGRGG